MVQELYVALPELEFVHVLLEVGFALMLMYGFYLFDRVWTMKSE